MSNLGNTCVAVLLLAVTHALVSCAGDTNTDNATPQLDERKDMVDRLSESGGFKQDASGNWVPKSDKRSSYDSQRDAPNFKGKIERETYKTGEYAKKTWWGTQKYEAGEYQGNTDGSRFQTKAKQDGIVARDAGKKARLEEPFQTNTLDRLSAREGDRDPLERPTNAYTESQKSTYKAPSVIDWKEQRQMSEKSSGILGR